MGKKSRTGTNLALPSGDAMPNSQTHVEKVYRRAPATPPALHCHWTRVDGPLVAGHATSSAVWICEYPYPTMLLAPPDDCEGCPAREALRRSA